MLLAALLIVAGLALLTFGGELLVRGAAALAGSAGVSPAVIGLTIVAAGTSTPELVVSVRSALAGSPDLALGNVVGSNIFNIAAILGIAALVAPLRILGDSVRLEWPVMFLAALQLHMLARDGSVDRLEGGFLLAALLVFIAYLVHVARVDVGDAERQALTEHSESAQRGARRLLTQALYVVGGCLLLVAGARALIHGSTEIARAFGMSERVIGLTIVACGTSLPELVTSVVASRRGHDDIAVANVLGSNIFNALGILGCTALIQPLAANAALVRFDDWWMIGLSALLLPLMRSGMRVSRIEGAALLLLYGAYLAALIAAP
ncbi:MAG: calcium/sodium antiporter [Myxococcales bacterium]|nr:calcium/sodium antiporter [Myxococcales bacterium]